MAIVEDRDAVQLLHPFDFRCERFVIDGVPGLAAQVDLAGRGFFAVQIDRAAVEIGHRAERRRVLPRIEADAFRVPVGIDDISVEGGADHGRAGQKVGIEPVHVPVGVGNGLTRFVQPGADVVGNEGARMRHTENDRAVAGKDLDRLHDCHPRSRSLSLDAAAVTTPENTRSAAHLMSGAR